MLEALTRINWLGVLAATVATTILGGVWFALLFGEVHAAVVLLVQV